MEEQAFLRAWVEEKGCLISTALWQSWHPVSDQTLEHEVRLRLDDRRAMKKTWPGTFGFVPRWDGKSWLPAPRNPGGVPPPHAPPKCDLPRRHPA